MRCLISRSKLIPLARLLARTAYPAILGVLVFAAAVSARAQIPATTVGPDTSAPVRPVALAAAGPATSTTAFLGESATGGAAESNLNPDEARRLYFRTGPVQPPREVTLPPAAERKRLTQLREQLIPAAAPEATLLIKALEGFLDYDQDDQIIYSPGRTRIRYGNYFLEADKVIMDVRLQEVQAEGDVVMMIGQDKLSATSLRYNFKNEEGVAFNVSGEHDPVYFRPAKPKKPAVAGAPAENPAPGELPQFQKVSKQETIFHDTNVTTCDFKIPHYYVRGREVILFQNDRVFLRGATFYVWDIPVLYLPTFTRSLTETSPWFTHLGYNSRAGAYARVGYAYEHETQEPSFENEGEYLTRSAGKAEVYVDYLSNIGPGLGMDYRYKFEYNKHRGQLSLYNAYDQSRKVVGASPDFLNTPIVVNGETVPAKSIDPNTNRFQENERYRYFWQHRTDLTKNLNLTVNIDEFSDPDIFYDILDLFGDRVGQRQRQIVRRTRVALTDTEEAFVARLMVDIKDRIGLDRINNFSNPDDDNRDLDLNPYTTLKNGNVDGISGRRWGRVSERAPQFDLATRYLPIGNRPVYYMTELNIYNNLDKGLNIVNTNDDAWVQGAQFYNRLLYQWKLSERYTLLAKAGVGAGTARRSGESLGIDTSDQEPIINSIQNQFWVDGEWSGVQFIDDNGTFLIGKRKRNLNQIKDNYLYGDAEVQFNAHFSDALTGNLDWRYRKTTTDYIGDWYASLGDQTVREDLFNYPIREHWISGGLNYHLARPLMSMSSNAGWNLEPKSDLYSKEDVGFWSNSVNWSNQRHTLVTNANIGITRQQLFDPTDPNQYQENRLHGGFNVGYVPIHQRWYTYISTNYNNPLTGPVKHVDNTSKLTYFTESQPDTNIDWTYGRELGPKYNTEFRINWDQQVGGIRDVYWMLQRDLHDAIAQIRIQEQIDNKNPTSRTDSNTQLDVRFSLKFKLPNKDVMYSSGQVKTLRDTARQPIVAY